MPEANQDGGYAPVDDGKKWYEKLWVIGEYIEDKNVQEFVENILPTATRIEAEYKIPTSVTIGQAILESASGQSTPKDVHSGAESFNLFGIKARDGEPYVESWTWEEVNGEKKKVLAKFRKFESYEGSLEGYAQLLSGAKRYSKAFERTSPYYFIDEVAKGGYATDSSYATKVKKIMKQYHLTEFDGLEFDGSLGQGFQEKLKDLEEAYPDVFEWLDNWGVNVILIGVGVVILILTLKSMFLGSDINVTVGGGE